MTLNCVVHYSHLVLENQVVTPLKEATYSKLLEGRESRIALGGDHLHSEQCESVPSKLEVTKHGYHRQCYAKFTNAISVAKSKRRSTLLNEQQEETKRPKRAGEFSGIIFPKICMICKSTGPKKVKGSRQKIKPIQTTTACNTFATCCRSSKG